MYLEPTTISAIATIVIAALTFSYVRYTAQLLTETKKSALNQKMPILILTPIRSVASGGGLAFEESVVNVGAGPAIDIKFESNGDFDGTNFNGVKKDLSEYSLAVNVLGVHTGDQTTRTFFWKSDNGRSILSNKDFKAKLYYKDVFNRNFESTYESCRNEFHQIEH